MSFTPDSRSRSLSPSDESRFVPHSSVLGASSVMERHFVTNQDGKALAKQVHREEDNITAQDHAKPNLVVDDEKSVGLVGATICFTPEPSPRSSPNLEGVRGELTNIGSLSESSNYIGSLHGYTTGDSGMEGTASKMSTSAVQIASSLDGRSTTEYEILDGISSRGTIELEDLSLDEESPNSNLPSLNFGEDHDDNSLVESPLQIFKTLSDEEHHKETLILDDITRNQEPKDDDSPATSPKVDEHPLIPFRKILNFWERKSTFASMVGRPIGTETSPCANTDEASHESRTHPSDTHVDESRSLDQQSQNPTKVRTAMPFAKVKNALIFISASVMSFIASASTLVWMFLCGFIAHVLGILKRKFEQIWLRNMTGGTVTQIMIDACPSQDEVNSAEDPSGLTRTNLSTLFEALNQKRIVGWSGESVHQFESEEHERSRTANNVTALDQYEKAILKTINDMVTDGVVTKFKRILSCMKFSATRVATTIVSSSFISTMMICNILPPGINVFRKSMDIPSVEEDNLHCVSTKMSSFVSVPLWELILSPMFYEQGGVIYNEAPGEEGPSSWSWTIFIVFIMTSFVCAFIFKPKIPFPSTIPKRVDTVITGIWSEEEHRQFLEGYKVHGSRWKLVCAFVPTRTHAQVRTHGSYWLNIHSPQRMIRTRKQDSTFGSPNSVSSSKTTPRKSNKYTVTPKGILREKDLNRFKHFTPKSEGRTTKMLQMQGSISDPVKRVKIEAP